MGRGSLQRAAGVGATVLLVAVAMSAVFAGAATAKTDITFVDSTGVIPTGTVITATSWNLTFTSESGIFECENNVLPGTVTANGGTKAETKTSEEHSFGNFDEVPGACKSSVLIPLEIEATEFPWSGEFKASKTKPGEGEFEEKGDKKVAFIMTAEYPELGEKNKCEYEASKIISTFSLGTPGHPDATEFTTSEQAFVLNKKLKDTAAICAKTYEADGTWSVTDANGQVYEE